MPQAPGFTVRTCGIYGGASRLVETVDLYGDADGLQAAWDLGDLSSAVELLADAMTRSLLPAPGLVCITPTTAPSAGETYTFVLTGTTYDDTVQTDTIVYDENDTGAMNSSLRFRSLNGVTASKSGGANDPDATDIGWPANDRYTMPPDAEGISLQVDGIGVYCDPGGVPSVIPALVEAAFHWPDGTIITNWGLNQGVALYFAPESAAVAGNCVRVQTWK